MLLTYTLDLRALFMKFPLHSVCFLLALAATSECGLSPWFPARRTTTTKRPATHKPLPYSSQRHPRVKAKSVAPPQWVPQGPSVCPVMCLPHQAPGEQCGPFGCLCIIVLGSGTVRPLHCAYFPFVAGRQKKSPPQGHRGLEANLRGRGR
uniref:Putative secreted protein n=1 Tax=Amblyomma americanum TaxID=6943 RepID=A0A0C9S4J5_AMBAM